MTGRVAGKVALITGAARGQGRSHAIRLAEEGADIIAVDICAQIDSVPYPMSAPDDLAETEAAVKTLGRRIVAVTADVREPASLRAAYEGGVGALGPVDIVVANAGIAPFNRPEKPSSWQDAIDVNLTGTFNTVELVAPDMVERGVGGTIVLVSSTAGLTGVGGPSRGGLGYAASKHGVVGLMRTYANNLAPYSIRVNSVHPTGVNTPMVVNDALAAFFAGDPTMSGDLSNALPVELVEPVDVSNAVLWLASDEARYITGVMLPVDAGFVNRH